MYMQPGGDEEGEEEGGREEAAQASVPQGVAAHKRLANKTGHADKVQLPSTNWYQQTM